MLPSRMLDLDALDRADPLGGFRDRFALPRGVVYLDGNSLGCLPRATAARVADVVAREWGDGLIRSWNEAGWIDLPRRVGAKIARLIGAGDDEVIVADSTSINLFKLLAGASRAEAGPARDPHRGAQLPDRSLHRAGGRGAPQRRATQRARRRGDRGRGRHRAVVSLTHVDYRSSRMHDLAAVTTRAHEAGP